MSPDVPCGASHPLSVTELTGVPPNYACLPSLHQSLLDGNLVYIRSYHCYRLPPAHSERKAWGNACPELPEMHSLETMKPSCFWWHRPVALATGETGAEPSQARDLSELQSEFGASLGNSMRYCLKRRNKKGASDVAHW